MDWSPVFILSRVQFSGGTRGCTTFSRGNAILYPAASNGDIFFKNSEWGGGTQGTQILAAAGGGGNTWPPWPPPPHSYATALKN